MSTTTPSGGQVMTFDFKEKGTSRAFNKLNHHLFPQGILSIDTDANAPTGLLKTTGSDTEVQILPFRAVMQDDENGVTVNLYTTENASVTVSPARPYIVGRWEWLDIENNYMEFRAVSFTGTGEDSLQPTDIIFGKCIFNVTTLANFDITRRTWSKDYYEGINERDPNFLVCATETSEGSTKTVTVGKGSAYIGGKKVEFTEQQISPEFNTTFEQDTTRKVLVSINASGQIVLTYGEPAVDSVAPAFPANMLTIAVVSISPNISTITGDMIEYVYNNNPVQVETITKATFDAEVARATEAETTLNNSLTSETDRATTKENSLSDDISNLDTRLSADIQTVEDALDEYKETTDASIEAITNSKGQSNGIASLDENGRIPFSQLPESAMEYKGNWDASTNTPTLANGTGTNGDFYICSVGGTVDFGDGAIEFKANDRVIYSATTQTWGRLNAGTVYTVNGRSATTSGNVIVNGTNIPLNNDSDTNTVASTIASLQSSLTELEGNVTSYANLYKNRESRSLKDVFVKLGEVSENATNQAVISALKNRADTENFEGLMLGDYFDLSSLGISSTGDTGGSVSNDNERLRFVIAGFNHYKNVGDTATSGGILMIAKNVVFQYRMNSDNTNNGGWASTELRNSVFLGSSGLAVKLASALGVSLKTVYRLLATGTQASSWAWCADQVFLPTEGEVFGQTGWGYGGYSTGTSVQYPIFSVSPSARIALLNGNRHWWWEASPSSAHSTHFCYCDDNGRADRDAASDTDLGVRFAFYL